MLSVKITDEGLGMTEDKIKHIFEPFVNIETHERKILNPQSNGIGLSICKSICESLGGSIHVESTLEEGSQFIFKMNVFTCNRERPMLSLNDSADSVLLLNE